MLNRARKALRLLSTLDVDPMIVTFERIAAGVSGIHRADGCHDPRNRGLQRIRCCRAVYDADARFANPLCLHGLLQGWDGETFLQNVPEATDADAADQTLYY